MRDEFDGPVVPVELCVFGFVRGLVPAVPADEEAGEQGVVGGGRAEAMHQP